MSTGGSMKAENPACRNNLSLTRPQELTGSLNGNMHSGAPGNAAYLAGGALQSVHSITDFVSRESAGNKPALFVQGRNLSQLPGASCPVSAAHPLPFSNILT